MIPHISNALPATSALRLTGTNRFSTGPLTDDSELKMRGKSQVRVVSFDLDNTIWKTSPTIASANDALSSFLADTHNVPSTVRVERIMKDLFQADPAKYSPVLGAAATSGADSAAPRLEPTQGSPVYLTMLRKDAIRAALINHADGAQEGDPDEALLSERIEQAFEHWVGARHDAITRHMAEDVASCLAEIAALRTAEGHPVLIGAITDGNSDPSLVASLQPYFDFCVNAERVGVSKPDKRVYLEAASIVLSHPNFESTAATSDARKRVEERLGPWWVHIGDDFIKDVVASKSLGMRSVWCRELVTTSRSPVGRVASKDKADAEAAPSRTVEDLVKQVSEMKVVRMEVGADDYLAASLHEEFADAIVDRFADLAPLLNQWHGEGLLTIANDDVPSADEVNGDGRQYLDNSSPLESSEPLPAKSTKDAKFCIHCGAKLPAVAAFCSACGQKQV
jgi:FMN hydrolase / 5-amino-6-(5-phospho-D-ribitylamino)uracil phosphatase